MFPDMNTPCAFRKWSLVLFLLSLQKGYGLLDFVALGVVSASRSPSTNWIPAKTIWAICGVPNSNTV